MFDGNYFTQNRRARLGWLLGKFIPRAIIKVANQSTNEFRGHHGRKRTAAGGAISPRTMAVA